MNTGLAFLTHLFYHNIYCDGEYVPIIKKPYPVDKTPCITLDEQDTRLHSRFFTYEPYEWLNREYDTSIMINLWCDTENDRQTILDEIHKVFNWLETDNYQLCTNYEDGECLFLETDCPVPSSKHGRCMKHQCPYPTQYHYTNLFTFHQVYRNTLNVSEGVDNDEYDRKPVLLRTIIQVSFKYITRYCNDGKISETLEYMEE